MLTKMFESRLVKIEPQQCYQFRFGRKKGTLMIFVGAIAMRQNSH